MIEFIRHHVVIAGIDYDLPEGWAIHPMQNKHDKEWQELRIPINTQADAEFVDAMEKTGRLVKVEKSRLRLGSWNTARILLEDDEYRATIEATHASH